MKNKEERTVIQVNSKIRIVRASDGLQWQASMINKVFFKARTANSPKMAIEAVFES